MFDFEYNVSVDPDDILDYVRDNKEWFLDQLGVDDKLYKNKMRNLSQAIYDKCNNEWYFLKKVRDGTSNLTDKEIIEKCKKMYDQIEDFGECFYEYSKD